MSERTNPATLDQHSSEQDNRNVAALESAEGALLAAIDAIRRVKTQYGSSQQQPHPSDSDATDSSNGSSS